MGGVEESGGRGKPPEVAKKGYSTVFQKLRKPMVLVFCNLAKNVMRVNL